MSITTLFRVILLSGILTAIIGTVVGSSLQDSLPSHLQAYLLQVDITQENFTQLEAILALVFLIVLIASFVGMWKFKHWARILYISCIILILPFYGTFGPIVESPWEAMFLDVSTTLEGVTVAMMWLEPLNERFNLSKRQSVL